MLKKQMNKFPRSQVDRILDYRLDGKEVGKKERLTFKQVAFSTPYI